MAMLIAHIYLLYTGFACGESTCFGDMPGVLAENYFRRGLQRKWSS